MNIYLAIYLMLNCLVTGWTYEEWYWPKTFSQWIRIIFGIIFFLSLGIVFIAVIAIGAYVVNIYSKLNRLFQLSFWFRFYFTNYYRNLTTEQLEKINKTTYYHWNSDNLHDRIFRYCTKLVNARHGYTYVHKEPEF